MFSKAQANTVLVGAVAVLAIVFLGLIVLLVQPPQGNGTEPPVFEGSLDECIAQECTGTVDFLGKSYRCGIDVRGQCRTQEIRNGSLSPVCGNAKLETGEECENTSHCSAGMVCSGCKCIQSNPSLCGNGVLDAGEDCDGGLLGGNTCQTLGFESGTVSCKGNCLEFDTTQCINSTTAPVPTPTTGYIPLSDLGNQSYEGFEGGLYPNGQNSPPADYLAFGLEKSLQVEPLDEQVNTDQDGKIGLLSVGMSNVNQEFGNFIETYQSAPGINPRLVFVQGAQGGVVAEEMSGNDPSEKGMETFELYWNETFPHRLGEYGVTAEQVQVVWLKQAISLPSTDPLYTDFPDYSLKLQEYEKIIIGMLKERLPNLKLVYVSDRTYGGCAKTTLNPEPYAYQTSFGVKWLIEDYIENPDGQVYVQWGPDLWADGTNTRSDGLTWTCDNFREDDRTHPSIESGRQKVADLLHNFLSNDATSKEWYLG